MKLTEKNRDIVAEIIDGYVMSISTFITKNSGIIIFCIFLGILAFGYELFNFTLSIDEVGATWSKFSDLSKLWVQQGRWSNFFLFNLFLRESLIPFIPTLVAVVFLIISCLIFMEILEGDKISKVIFCCIFITFPSNAFFMEFNTNFGISIGIASVATSFLLFKYYIENNKKSFLILSIVMAAFGIGVYQSIISIWFCIMFLYILSIICNNENKFIYNELKKITIIGSFVLTFSFLLYKLIDFSFKGFLKVDSGKYLDNYIGWGNNSVFDTLSLVFSKHVMEHLFGQSFYGEKTIIVIWIAIVLLLLRVCSIKDISNKFVGLVSILLVTISPFILSLALGSILPIRSLVGLPLMVGGIVYISAINVIKTLRYILLIIAILIAFYNSFTITRLFYSDHLNHQADRDLANRVIGRVSLLDVNFENKPIPIAFVGEINRENLAFIKSEVFGSSVFQFGGPSQFRINCFLRTLGIEEFDYVNLEQLKYSIQASKNMKAWPHKDSVSYKEGMVIVKLGEATKMQLAEKFH